MVKHAMISHVQNTEQSITLASHPYLVGVRLDAANELRGCGI